RVISLASAAGRRYPGCRAGEFSRSACPAGSAKPYHIRARRGPLKRVPPGLSSRIAKGDEHLMNRTFLLALSLGVFLAPVAASAGPRDDVLQALGKCAAIAESSARLSCYDGLAPQLKAALATAPARFSGTPSLEQQKSWFGFSLDSLF